MANTETLQHSLNRTHPPFPRLRKSRSFKENATLFLNKFSNTITASKSEQQLPPVRSTSLLRKCSIAGAKNAIKRQRSTAHTDLKTDRKKNDDEDDVNSLNSTDENSKNNLPTDLSIKLKNIASSLSSKVTPKNMSSNIVNEHSQSKHSMNETSNNKKKPEDWQKNLKSNEPYTCQKSVSSPVKSTKKSISTNAHHHVDCSPTSRYNWANGKLERVCAIQPLTPIRKVSSEIMLVESVSLEENHAPSLFDFCSSSPVSSDDEDAIATPFPCDTVDWPSSDINAGAMRSDAKICMTKRRPRKTEDTILPSSLSSYKFDTDINSDEVKYTKRGKANTLERLKRSSTIMSVSSCESITSSCSTSSLSVFNRPSEFNKKESKAISMWYHTVQKLTQHNIFNKMNNVPKHAEKNQAIARFIISELYTTEKSFHQLLLFIRSNYMEPLCAASQSKNPLVRFNDVRSLFYCLPSLISMSEKLIFKLEEHMEDPDNSSSCPGQTVGRIFKDLEQDFVVFVKYAVHYQCHMKSIRRASHSGLILKIDIDSRNSRENNRLGLDDYLIAPFQRVPRYGLLIRDLLKHTEVSEQNIGEMSFINDLTYARIIVDGLAIAMDQVQKKVSKPSFSTINYSSSNFHSTSDLVAQHPLAL